MIYSYIVTANSKLCSDTISYYSSILQDNSQLIGYKNFVNFISCRKQELTHYTCM